MPMCMNRLGEMTNLVTLKLSQNKLRSLPTRYHGKYIKGAKIFAPPPTHQKGPCNGQLDHAAGNLCQAINESKMFESRQHGLRCILECQCQCGQILHAVSQHPPTPFRLLSIPFLFLGRSPSFRSVISAHNIHLHLCAVPYCRRSTRTIFNCGATVKPLENKGYEDTEKMKLHIHVRFKSETDTFTHLSTISE